MHIKKVQYKIDVNDKWKIGYVIGKHKEDNRTLLDIDFNYVSDVKDIKEECLFLAYGFVENVKKMLNM